MNPLDALRKWETYAYRIAHFLANEERRAADLAGAALLDIWERLAAAPSEREAQAMVKRAVLRRAVLLIGQCLEEKKQG